MQFLRRLLLISLCTFCTATTSQLIEKPFASEASPGTIVTFTADENGFKGPEQLPAGIVTVRLHNLGQEPHQLQLLKLLEGKTPADLAAALKGSSAPLPQWANHMGGPNAIGPGQMAEATIALEPGSYVLMCEVPHKREKPNDAPGMLKSLRVIDASSPVGAFSGNLHMAMLDYEFVVAENLRRGTHTFHVINRGTQTHQVSVLRLSQGASVHDVLTAFRQTTPPSSLPGELMGGMTGLEPGARGTFTVALTPGRYALVCLFPNPASPESHAAKGMVKNFTIE